MLCNNLFAPLLIFDSESGRPAYGIGLARAVPSRLHSDLIIYGIAEFTAGRPIIYSSPSELRSNCGRAHDPGRSTSSK